MKFLFFLITLFVTAVTAIDVRFTSELYCNGPNVACVNLAPNTCCYAPNEGHFAHIIFGAVPGDWRITMQGNVQYDCKGLRTGGDSHTTSGLQDYCYAGPGFPQVWRSGKYWFRNDARDFSKDPDVAANCSLVDTLILEDDTRYALHGLDEDKISQAIEFMVNGTAEEAVKVFGLSRVTQERQ